MVTAGLGEKVILDGVTRRSVLELVGGRLRGEVEVVERGARMGEVVSGVGEGRLLEAFVCGTAVGFCCFWLWLHWEMIVNVFDSISLHRFQRYIFGGRIWRFRCRKVMVVSILRWLRRGLRISCMGRKSMSGAWWSKKRKKKMRHQRMHREVIR